MSDELLTPAQVSETFKVGVSTVSRWAKNGDLTPIRVGRTLRFRRDEIEKLIKPAAAEQAS